MITVSIKLFAAARETVGNGETTLALPDGATIGDVRAALREKHPQLEPLLPHAMFAVDANYATDQSAVEADSEIACIPPVSGG